jgi:hypothetical protein
MSKQQESALPVALALGIRFAEVFGEDAEHVAEHREQVIALDSQSGLGERRKVEPEGGLVLGFGDVPDVSLRGCERLKFFDGHGAPGGTVQGRGAGGRLVHPGVEGM